MHAARHRCGAARFVLASLCLLLACAAPAEQHSFACTTNEDGTLTLAGYMGSGGDVRIPSAIGGRPVASIGYEAFYGALGKPSHVFVPDSVTNIGAFAFFSCARLNGITLGSRVASIGDYAFAFCDLAELALPESVTTIGDAAFINCRLIPSVTIPDRVASIGPWAFEYCASVTNVVIGNSVTNIGYGAFRRCMKLARVTVGPRVAALGGAAFDWCPRLKGVYFLGNAPSAGWGVLGDDDEAVVYRLPEATGWEKTFGERPTAVWDPQAGKPAAVGAPTP